MLLGNMELLWSWLSDADHSVWLHDLAGISANFVIRKPTLDQATIGAIDKEITGEHDPVIGDSELVTPDGETKFFGTLQSLYGVKLLGRISIEHINNPKPQLPNWTLRLLDDHERRKSPQFQESWRAFLQAMNLLQFQFADRGFYFVSTEDLAIRSQQEADIYPLPRPHEGYSIAAERPAESVVEPNPYEELGMDQEEQRIAEAVVAAGGPMPDVGFELGSRTGRCGAEAELAWPDSLVAVLFAGDPTDAAAFEREGWRVFKDPIELNDLTAAVCAKQESGERN